MTSEILDGNDKRNESTLVFRSRDFFQVEGGTDLY